MFIWFGQFFKVGYVFCVMKEEKYVYRFIDFLGFVNLVQNKNLAFVKPELWEDPFENYVFKKLESRSGQEEIVKVLEELGLKDIPSKMLSLCFNKNSVFGQSWSMLSESDALWRIYSSINNSVRISVSIENIEKLSETYDNFYCSAVNYKKSIDLKEEVLNLFKGKDFSIFCVKGMLTKRNSFSHEKEFRLLYVEDESHYSDSFFREEVEKFSDENYVIDDEFYNTLDKVNKISRGRSKIRTVSIENPSKFISSVMLHPQAEDWVDETVSKYCELNKIKYLGRSKLYEFE